MTLLRLRLAWLLGVGFAACACDPGSQKPLPIDPGVGGIAGAGGVGVIPVEEHGQLRVDEGRLVDEAGEPVQLKGASSMWLNWEARPYAENLSGLIWMRDRWKLQVIRAAMGVDVGGGYLVNAVRARSQVDTIIDNAVKAGVYVIVDWHDHTAHEHREAAEKFFADLADDYGDLPNVLYETYNEPERATWEGEVKPYHEAVVAAIRQHDPDNVIILGTPNWSQFVDEAAASPVAGSNLLYTLHFYACSHGQTLRDRGDLALAQGLGLFVTEWGATDADGGLDGVVCLDEAERWMTWMDDNALSWTAWKLDSCSDSSCYFNNNAPVDGGWTDAELQGHGPFVRDQMRR